MNKRKRCAELCVQVAHGVDPAEAVREGRSEQSFKELFDDYVVNRRTTRGGFLHPKTVADYKTWFRLYLSSWAARRISHISDRHVAELHARLGREKPYAANRILSLVQGLYSYAIEKKLYFKPNPARGIRRFPEVARERFVQTDEMPAFFKALAEEENETFRDYILLSLLTGARRGNVMAMRWQDVNLERREWHIPKTKGGGAQTVPLSPEAIELLKGRNPLDIGFVFPGPGKHGHIVEPKKAWQRVLDRARLSNLRLHDLRRTLGSWQAKSGASLAIVGKSLGHKSPTTTAIYARLDLDPVRESMERATDAMLLAGLVKKKPISKKTKKKAKAAG